MAGNVLDDIDADDAVECVILEWKRGRVRHDPDHIIQR